jgi:hypothetical protein
MGCYISIYIELVVGFVTSDVSIADKNHAMTVFVVACGLLLVGSCSEMGVRGVFPVLVVVGVLFGYARIGANFLELDSSGQYYEMYLSGWRWALLSYGVSAIAQVLVSNRFAQLYRQQLLTAFYPKGPDGQAFDPTLEELFIKGFDKDGERTLPHLYINTTAGGIGKRRDMRNRDPLANVFTERYRAFVFSDRCPKGEFIMDKAHKTHRQVNEEKKQRAAEHAARHALAAITGSDSSASSGDDDVDDVKTAAHPASTRVRSATEAGDQLKPQAKRQMRRDRRRSRRDREEFKEAQDRKESVKRREHPWISLSLSRAMALSGAAISTAMGSDLAWIKGLMALSGISMGAWYALLPGAACMLPCFTASRVRYDFKDGRVLDFTSFGYGGWLWRGLAFAVTLILGGAFLVALVWSTYALGLWCLVIVVLHAAAVVVTLVTSANKTNCCYPLGRAVFRFSLFLRERIPSLRTFHQMLLNNPLDIEGDPSTLDVNNALDTISSPANSPTAAAAAEAQQLASVTLADHPVPAKPPKGEFVPHIYLTDGAFIDNLGVLPFVAEGTKTLHDLDVIICLDAEFHDPDSYEVLKRLLSSREYLTGSSHLDRLTNELLRAKGDEAEKKEAYANVSLEELPAYTRECALVRRAAAQR